MKLVLLGFFFITLTAFSCHQTHQSVSSGRDSSGANDATRAALSPEDSMRNDVLAIHDEVMPKMGKLTGYQKMAQQRLDSLDDFMMRARLTPGAAKAFAEKKDSLNHLIFDLKLAEKEMFDWMGQFVTEPKMPTAAERLAYFQDQKEKASKMRDQFFSAYNRARDMFGERN